MTIKDIATLITEIGVLLGVITAVIVFIKKIAEGVKCLLRSKMLETYYRGKVSNLYPIKKGRGKVSKTIRQYEKENFVLCYAAYKALRGNSFIDDINKEVRTWEVLT